MIASTSRMTTYVSHKRASRRYAAIFIYKLHSHILLPHSTCCPQRTTTPGHGVVIFVHIRGCSNNYPQYFFDFFMFRIPIYFSPLPSLYSLLFAFLYFLYFNMFLPYRT